jgi:2-(1,2-epoxy-1,2-dihydrophenyl)acetyl-CoA isomerase
MTQSPPVSDDPVSNEPVSDEPGSDEPVRYDTDGAVVTITINRPASHNALDRAAREALRDAVLRAATDDSARCVVLTGAGDRAFCAGQDLREHAKDLTERSQEEIWSAVPDHYVPMAHALATMPKPVVAAVNGVAAGAGAALAFACDFRVLADTAGFNLAFSGIGLSCDTGSSWTLPRLVGHAKAVELLMRPRTVSAEEAVQLGLATSVVPGDALAAEAAGLARELAAGPTVAYASIREALNYSATHPLAESLAFEGELMRRTGATEDHRDAVAAFRAKQRPTFQGR